MCSAVASLDVAEYDSRPVLFDFEEGSMARGSERMELFRRRTKGEVRHADERPGFQVARLRSGERVTVMGPGLVRDDAAWAVGWLVRFDDEWAATVGWQDVITEAEFAELSATER